MIPLLFLLTVLTQSFSQKSTEKVKKIRLQQHTTERQSQYGSVRQRVDAKPLLLVVAATVPTAAIQPLFTHQPQQACSLILDRLMDLHHYSQSSLVTLCAFLWSLLHSSPSLLTAVLPALLDSGGHSA